MTNLQVPAAQDGQNGTASAPAQAVNAGATGNIPAQALATRCCGGVHVGNPGAFTGGVDAQSFHVLTQADLKTNDTDAEQTNAQLSVTAVS